MDVVVVAVVVPVVVIVAALAFVIAVRLRISRRRARYSAEDQARVAEAERRLRRFPPRYINSALVGVVVLSVASHLWVVFGAAVVVMVGMLVIIERHRREVLRDVGFDLSKWGSAKIDTGKDHPAG